MKTQAPSEVEIFPLMALEQAEEIEREAWWVLTNQRLEGRSSPFRVFRFVQLKRSGKTKSLPSLQFCQKLEIQEIEPQVWQLQARCQKSPQDVGTLRKQGPLQYRLQWVSSPFSSHFGLGASIFYAKQTCDFELTSEGRLKKMSCPGYARNRTSDEVVELKIFEFLTEGSSVLKLQGDVKKDLHVIATIQTEVPWAGDIVVKEKQRPQKSVEVEAEVPHSNAKKLPTQELPREEKDDEKSGGQKDRQEKYQENREKKREENRDLGEGPRSEESGQVDSQERRLESGSEVDVPAPSR